MPVVVAVRGVFIGVWYVVWRTRAMSWRVMWRIIAATWRYIGSSIIL